MLPESEKIFEPLRDQAIMRNFNDDDDEIDLT
jgi:hypothetical protein